MTTTTRKRAPGAGRPRVGSANAVRVTISLPPEYVAYLRGVDDNLSAAVRNVIDKLAEIETTEER